MDIFRAKSVFIQLLIAQKAGFGLFDIKTAFPLLYNFTPTQFSNFSKTQTHSIIFQFPQNYHFILFPIQYISVLLEIKLINTIWLSNLICGIVSLNLQNGNKLK